MATGKNTVQLVVEAGVTGEADIRRLADDVRRLGREGGDAAPEFQALAAQLDRLGDQAAAVARLREVSTQVDVLAVAQREAAISAEAFGNKLAAAAEKAAPLRQEQARLAEAVREAELGVVKAKGALDNYVAGFTRGEKDTAEFVQRQAQLKAALNDARVAVVEQQQALDRLTPGVRAATAEEAKLQRQYEFSQTKVGEANDALRRRNTLLQESQAAVLAAGASTSDLAAAEQAILEATQASAIATQRLTSEREQAAAAAAEAAAIEAAAAAESTAAMKRLEEAARQADTEFREFTASLRAAEAAEQEFTAATERAAAAGLGDAATMRQRVAAAERLVASERELSVAQREAINQRNAGRAALVAEAQALLQVAVAARETQAATTATATAARQAGEALQQAFSTIGIRSIDAIEAEIEQTAAALTKLEIAARRGSLGQDELGRSASVAEAKIARLRQEIIRVETTPSQFERMSQGIQNIVTRFGALGAAIATVGVAVRPVIDATVALEQMRRVLTQVTGSAEIAEQQIEFLRRTSQASGQSFTEVGQSYAKFAASALQSGLSVQQVNDVFKSVSLAAGNLGLSTDQAKRALEALSQIASKGTVNMEELRQQLGDALPGVLPLLAKELGLTQRELIKVVESGQLLASEAIPAIGRSLNKLQPAGGQVEGLVASFNRFVNVIKEAGTVIVEGPLGQAAGTVLGALAGVIRDVAVVAVSASEAFKLFGLTVVATADALTPGGEKIADLGAKLDGFAQAAASRIAAFKDTAYGADRALDGLGKTAGFTGESFAKLTLEQQKLIEGAKLQAQSAEKNVQAKKAEADAITTLAGLLGDETQARIAGAEAAKLVFDATQEQLRADQALVASLQQQKALTLERVAAGKETIENVKALIEEIDKKIAQGTADVEKTQAQADAARSLATQTRLAVESIGDQSKRLDELKTAVKQAADAQVLATRRWAEGKGSLDSVKTASEQLAKAKGLLRDAINDLDDALKRQLGTLKADLEIKRASLALDLEQARTAQRLAIERGNEFAAKQAGIRIAQIELTLQKTNISGKLQEAEATLRYVDTKEKELRAIGALTPERQQELDLLRKGAIAQTLEEAARRESLKAGEEQLAQLQGLVPSREAHTGAVQRDSEAVGGNSGSLRGNSDALRDNGKAADLAATARQRYNDLLIATRGLEGGAGGTGLGGIRAPKQSSDTLPPIDSFGSLIRNTPDGGITRTAAGQLKPPDDSGDWFLDTSRKGEGPFGLGVWTRKSPSNDGKGFAPFTSGFPGGVQSGFPGYVPPTPTPAPAPAPAGGNYNVQVVIGGRSIAVAAKDMQSINAMIEALEAAYRAGGGG